MSSFKKIIKKSEIAKSEKKIYLDDRNFEEEDIYLEKTFESKKQKMEEELKFWEEEEINKINAQTERIKNDAYEEGKKNAYDEVFEQVKAENEKKLAKDYEEKMDEARKVYKEANTYLIKTEDAIERRKNKWVEEKEEELSEIMRITLKKMLGKELKMQSIEMRDILKETLKESTTKNKNVWVRVSPETKDIIDGKQLGESNIEIIADPNLKTNDFMIETDSEWIDGSLESKLNVFKKKIKEWIEKNEVFD
jgi:flagellar assembly protein FliH